MLALDLLLAILHHLAFLLLTAALVVEWTRRRASPHALQLARRRRARMPPTGWRRC
jgi:putative membrane protein